MKKIDYLWGMALLACVAYIVNERRDHHWYVKIVEYAQAHPEKTMNDFIKDYATEITD